LIKIYNFNACKLSYKNGSYGGLAGEKDGVLINGEEWLIKYPKNLSGMKGEVASYSTAPLSEYLGSHIYKILGIDVHETLLGEKNGKIVVACKDFAVDNKMLLEIRTIKNHTGLELSEMLEEKEITSTDAHVVDLDELLLHIDKNPVLSVVDGIKDRFYEQAIIDIFINNNDRNNGNWGILRERGKKDKLAPVFDNGGSFSTKITNTKMKRIMDNGILENNTRNVITAYGKGEHPYSANKFMNYVENIEEFRNAILRIVPMINDKMDEIQKLIDEIPEYHIAADGKYLEVMSPIRKEFYSKQLGIRLYDILYPEYDKIQALNNPSVSQKDNPNVAKVKSI